MSSAFARAALASFVALHGIAHLAGTTDLSSRAADGRAADQLTRALGWTTLASLGLVIVALWASVIGLVIDLALLALVAVVLTHDRRPTAVAP